MAPASCRPSRQQSRHPPVSSAVNSACSPSLCSPRYAATSSLPSLTIADRPTLGLARPSSLWHFRASSTAFSMNSRSVPPLLATGRDSDSVSPSATTFLLIGMPLIVDSQGSNNDAAPTIDKNGRPSPSIGTATVQVRKPKSPRCSVGPFRVSIKEIGRINRRRRLNRHRGLDCERANSFASIILVVPRASPPGIVVSPALRHSLMAMVHATVSTPSQRTVFLLATKLTKRIRQNHTSCLSMGRTARESPQSREATACPVRLAGCSPAASAVLILLCRPRFLHISRALPASFRRSIGHLEDLQHLVAVVVDDLHGDLARLRACRRGG